MICCFKGRYRVTSPRGERRDPITGKEGAFHKGIDLVGIDDITVYSISTGTVKTAYQANGAGNYVVVTMDDGRRIFYMHLKSFLVKTGDRVVRGEPIGIMGATGAVTGAHTHLEIRPKGTTSDSLDIIEFTGLTNKTGTYEYKPKCTSFEAMNGIQKECGLESKTMLHLKKYQFASDLFDKLWRAMK